MRHQESPAEAVVCVGSRRLGGPLAANAPARRQCGWTAPAGLSEVLVADQVLSIHGVEALVDSIQARQDRL
ncbi:hypothetical protein ACPA9J_30265 [Pseudomonas aeruginosa]